jgi:zinc/manganese transport system substrate-binding protein
MSTRPLLPLATALVLLLAGCTVPTGGAATRGTRDDGRIRLLTSTSMWAGVARAVGGDRVAVTALLDDAGRDPHDYEATPRDQLTALHSDVLLMNGGGYDDFLARLARPVPRAKVVDVVTVSRRTADRELNEHLWYDLPTVARVAEALRDTFEALRPEERPGFEARTARFLAGVRRLEARERALRPLAGGRGAAITEPVADYLLTAAGLRIATPEAYSSGVEATGDVAPAALLQQLRLLEGRRVVLLAADADVTSPTVDRTVASARSAGIPVLQAREILPRGAGYLAWFGGQLDVVERAVRR